MEVYIDSTHRTNVNNAELYAIIGEECGVGVPIGYMLMEKKPTEDSTTYPREVIACCRRYFSYARELGLNPTMIHSDKDKAELATMKVRSLIVRSIVSQRYRRYVNCLRLRHLLPSISME